MEGHAKNAQGQRTRQVCAHDREAAAASRAVIKAEAAKAAGPRLELRQVTEPDGSKVTVRVWR